MAIRQHPDCHVHSFGTGIIYKNPGIKPGVFIIKYQTSPADYLALSYCVS